MLGGSGRRAAVVAAIFSLVLVAAGCSGDDGDGGSGGGDTGSSPTTDAGSGGSASITIAAFAFDPSTVTVSSGATEIEITNDDDTAHTFTLDDESVDEEIEPGGSATVTVDVSESTGFHCTIHPDMTGTLEVG